jgi:hypothetical protein
MRINVYAEEITNEVEIVTKQVDGRQFFAVRLFLKSASELHHGQGDDDRSAITFWVPWREGRNHPGELCDTLAALYSASAEIARADVERLKNKANAG